MRETRIRGQNRNPITIKDMRAKKPAEISKIAILMCFLAPTFLFEFLSRF